MAKATKWTDRRFETRATPHTLAVNVESVFLQTQQRGCQMVSFQTKNPNSGIFWRTLEWKMLLNIHSGHLEYFTTSEYILWAIGNFVFIWFIFPPLWYIAPRKIWQP
jgi:hypothetical protein